MNSGRLALAAIGVWVVRVALNWTFYTQVVGQQFQAIASAHPGVTREVIPAYIAADLLFALVFVYLFAKIGGSLGSGLKGGVNLGVIVAILSAVLCNLYVFYSVTYLPGSLMLGSSFYEIVAHAIQGAVAAKLYKP